MVTSILAIVTAFVGLAVIIAGVWGAVVLMAQQQRNASMEGSAVSAAHALQAAHAASDPLSWTHLMSGPVQAKQ